MTYVSGNSRARFVVCSEKKIVVTSVQFCGKDLKNLLLIFLAQQNLSGVNTNKSHRKRFWPSSQTFSALNVTFWAVTAYFECRCKLYWVLPLTFVGCYRNSFSGVTANFCIILFLGGNGKGNWARTHQYLSMKGGNNDPSHFFYWTKEALN